MAGVRGRVRRTAKNVKRRRRKASVAGAVKVAWESIFREGGKVRKQDKARVRTRRNALTKNGKIKWFDYKYPGGWW